MNHNKELKATHVETLNGFPYHINLDNISVENFVAYYKENESTINEKLKQNGAIKFRGIQIDSPSSFQSIINDIFDEFSSYVDGNSPRIKVKDNVYTSTEYPHTQKITMHNELSYSGNWPNKLIFCCIVAAQKQGETLIADGRRVLNTMDASFVEEIKEKGITYIRNLHSGMGLGPSWKDTFETEDKSEVNKHCERLNIEYEWKSDDSIRLIQRRKGTLLHKSTGEEVWFNQIDQFHPLHLGEKLYKNLRRLYKNTHDLPMFVEFGDGTEITEDRIKHILDTMEAVTIAPTWNQGDLLLIDNELVCHGRNPFEGERKVLVSMIK